MTKAAFTERLEEILRNSELIRHVTAIRDGLNTNLYRELLPDEVVVLESNGNSCANWEKVRVTEGFDPSNIRYSTFKGDIRIGTVSGRVDAGGFSFPAGIYSSTIKDCVIANDVVVKNIGFVSNYYMGDRAVLLNAGIISASDPKFGNGERITIATDTGACELLSFAELMLDVVETLARLGDRGELLDAYREFIAYYTLRTRLSFGIISSGAKVLNTPTVTNVFLGPAGVIDGAKRVENSTLLSNTDEITRVTHGACVLDSVIQWGCEVTSMAAVKTSVLTEHSTAKEHAEVTESIIGPNTVVARGGVTASLIGPFVGFNHEARFAATYWPDGKGNVAYGVNVCSPQMQGTQDRGVWIGEGIFLGLSAVVGSPSDYSQSPFSVIAVGVRTPAQKIDFPFSLINKPSAHVELPSPSANEIFPGWVLSNNMYMLKRNESKYKRRNRARHTCIALDVFRSDIMRMVASARERLQQATAKDFYTSTEIQGLGENYMAEAARLTGIEAYTSYLRYCALNSLRRELERGGRAEDIVKTLSADNAWEYCRKILIEEFPDRTVTQLLDLLVQMEFEIARYVEDSKKKDDIRGAKIILDYEETHTAAAEDAVVKETWAAAYKVEEEIEKLVSRI